MGAGEVFDFVVAGGGTGGLVSGTRLAEAGEKVLVIESGKMLTPVNQKIAYNLCKKVDGVLQWCSTFNKLVPLNWFTAVVNYQEFFNRTIDGHRVDIPLLTAPYFDLDDSKFDLEKGQIPFNNLQGIIDLFLSDPKKYGLLKNHPIVKKTLYKMTK